jgi:ATP-binding cassette subfamily A (ABC1) protein 3
MFFLLMVVLQQAFDLFNPGAIEEYLIPFSTWVFVQKVTTTILYEKQNRLHESMLMMGMKEPAYWLSYIISEGFLVGFLSAFFATLVGQGTLYDDTIFFEPFAWLWLYFITIVVFIFFVCAFFDTPQTGGQAAFAVNIACYVIYLSINLSYESEGLQGFLCVIPPIALQLLSGSYKKSYAGISRGTICGILFLDIALYSFLAWYFNQVWPSKIGAKKNFLFLFDKSYWFPSRVDGSEAESAAAPGDKDVPTETVNEKRAGAPTVRLDGLKKSFFGTPAVDSLSFSMYENQIFALLGHNGAGKTTTINMLTGLLPPDLLSAGDASIYGRKISSEMELIRKSMGVCPQHDVLFENLSVKEHILFFSQLKGASELQAQNEAKDLTSQFHLSERMLHLGSELSGGQKRKLSVAIAVSGGSKFIVLDEPTAGMDPLARRELWELLSTLRIGRTMLLTTHYMDEADVLGDRIGIMSLGKLQCLGSSTFLKKHFGAGYKLALQLRGYSGGSGSSQNLAALQSPTDAESESKKLKALRAALENAVTSRIPNASIDDSSQAQNDPSVCQMVLPFDSVAKFGELFAFLEKSKDALSLANFGVIITSLEDVFLKVGGDHSVKPIGQGDIGIGSDVKFESTFLSQLVGIIKRKWSYGRRDFVTFTIIALPAVAAAAMAGIYKNQVISKLETVNNFVAVGVYCMSYLLVPGLLAEFVVRERETKLRNVLVVSGCSFPAYWFGTFIADVAIVTLTSILLFITWGASNLTEFSQSTSYVSFLLFNFHVTAFAYLCTYLFTTPRSCIVYTPSLIIFLVVLPNLVISIITLIFDVGLHAFSIPPDVAGGAIFWGLSILSPHGALFSGVIDAVQDLSGDISNYPPQYATIIFQIVETALFLFVAYYIDAQSIASISRNELGDNPVDTPAQEFVASFSEKAAILNQEEGTHPLLANAADACILTPRPERGPIQDSDVLEEYSKTVALEPRLVPLRVERLRKVFPPKRVGYPPVVACAGPSFTVDKGEIFGLLGANGAGKTTCLSMLTRHIAPTSGEAHVAGTSLLQGFSTAAKHLGIVTQSNSLWDKLSVRDHLKLFARLRGVPTEKVKIVVEATIDQLELRPHATKLAQNLSGGMKRKLCVAIALIGDPDVCLLDEPSAGLDPVSRRNLWDVILRTMSHRSVVLTTHSMDEAEALCRRIGIMVQGQLRVLGSGQHLKHKFGSGYELVAKIRLDRQDKRLSSRGSETLEAAAGSESGKRASVNVVNADAAVSKCDAFIRNLFPTASHISTHGVLLTYRVPQADMSLGKAFKELEANKEELCLEEYSVSQPTLEQVFIRTVQEHTASKEGILMAGSGHVLSASEVQEEMRDPSMVDKPTELDLGDLALNKCGCTVPFTRRLVITFALLLVLFVVIGFASKTPQLFILSTISFISLLITCCVWQCRPCQPPSDDEN